METSTRISSKVLCFRYDVPAAISQVQVQVTFYGQLVVLHVTPRGVAIVVTLLRSFIEIIEALG